ncbi:MAG: O-antigen ligase family protein [Candidatus Woesebacteria bacterium]|jgi:O-antigen ligase
MSMSQKLRQIILFFFHFLLISTPFIFTWVNEELFEFNKMLFVYLLTTLIAASWLARMILEKRIIFKKSRLDLPIRFFLLSQILATIFSIHQRTSIFGYYTRFHGGLLSTISYIVLFYAFISNVKAKELKSFLKSSLLAAFLISLYAIPEHFGHSLSCIPINCSFTSCSSIKQIISSYDVSCWVQDVRNRVYASLGQPNWLAAYLITLLPLSISFFLKSKPLSLLATLKKNTNSVFNKINNLFYFLNPFLIFTALLFTKSRSGILALAFALVIYTLGIIWLEGKKQFNFRQIFIKPLFKSLLLLYTVFFLIAGIFGTTFTPSLKELWYSNSSQTTESINSPKTKNIEKIPSGGTESGDIRKVVWKGAIGVWLRYPLFGSGVETFAYSYYQNRPLEHNLLSEWDFLYNKAHNEFLNFLATTGIVGFIAYLALLVSFFIVASRSLLKEKQAEFFLITLGLVTGLIALSISNFFGFSTVMVSVLLFLYPAFVIVIESKKLKVTKKSSQTKLSQKQSLLTIKSQFKKIIFAIPSPISLSIVALVIFYCLNSIANIWLADFHFTQGKALVQKARVTEGLSEIELAIKKSPHEALFYNNLATIYADLALKLNMIEEKEASLELAENALELSNYALFLNPRHLIFYKNRIYILNSLAELKKEYLQEAELTAKQALLLSPTDAKLMFQLSQIKFQLGDIDEAFQALEASIKMKDNYLEARFYLGQRYEMLKLYPKAKEQYQYLLEHFLPNDPKIKERLEVVEASMSAEVNN